MKAGLKPPSLRSVSMPSVAVVAGLSALVQAAGGREYVFPGGIAAGGELGLLARQGGILCVASVNGSLHVSRSRSRRGFDPFVTGGYTNMGIVFR